MISKIKHFIKRVISYVKRNIAKIVIVHKAFKSPVDLQQLQKLYPQFRKQLPGFVYDEVRNFGSWHFSIKSKVKRIRLSLIANNPEILHFNHIRVWTRNEQGELEQIQSDYTCQMSSTAKAKPDPGAAMLGSRSNSVSVHSKKEVQPWWQITFVRESFIESIEFFNRKDTFGNRASSISVSAFNISDEKIYRWGRCHKDQRFDLFDQEVAQPIQQTTLLLTQMNQSELAEQFSRAWRRYLSSTTTDESVINQQRSLLLSLINQVCTLFHSDTPDIGNCEESAYDIDFPNVNAKYIRVIAFGKPKPRLPKIMIQIPNLKNKIFRLAPDDCSTISEDVLKLRQDNWALQQEYLFCCELGDDQETDSIRIWSEDRFRADVFVNRLVEVSEDGKNWITVDSTLEPMKQQLKVLRLYGAILGKHYDINYVKNVANFFATYRLTLARTFKPLLRNNSALKNTYIDEIANSGKSAKYLPGVIYTRHGLSIPFSELDSGFLAERMHAFAKFMEDSFGLKAFPCYGTLLGIHRDKDFLPHDDDIDVAVIVDLPEGLTPREATMQWIEKLNEVGIVAYPPTPDSINVVCIFPECDMDLFFIYRDAPDSKTVQTHMDRYIIRKIKRSLLEPIGTLEFMGRTFYAPANVEGFLKQRYGEGWITPDPTFEV